MSAALKRVEASIVGLGPYEEVDLDRAQVAFTRDLRSVLALAKQAVELKQRIRLARLELTDAPMVYTRHIDDLLDLRKPLPKRGRK